MTLAPISTIIPTMNRRDRLLRTLASILAQSVVPAEIIIIDASESRIDDSALEPLFRGRAAVPVVQVRPASVRGAAAQRNQAFDLVTQPYVLFSDDDIDLQPGCLAALWATMEADPTIGGCSVVILNQSYHPPNPTIRKLLAVLGCAADGSLAGRFCGPALNFLPELKRPTSAPVAVQWMNLACTLYRRHLLPNPPLLPFFSGYSLMEDVALSIQVGKQTRLAAVPAARIVHDSRPASYKDATFRRERMEVVNRWFVMTRVADSRLRLGKPRLIGYQCLMLLLNLRRWAGWRRLPAALAGQCAGFVDVFLHGRSWRGYEED